MPEGAINQVLEHVVDSYDEQNRTEDRAFPDSACDIKKIVVRYTRVHHSGLHVSIQVSDIAPKAAFDAFVFHFRKYDIVICARIGECEVDEADIRSFAGMRMPVSRRCRHGVKEFFRAHVPTGTLSWGNAMEFL